MSLAKKERAVRKNQLICLQLSPVLIESIDCVVCKKDEDDRRGRSRGRKQGS